MALKDRPYTDPAYRARHNIPLAEAGGAATTVYGRVMAMGAGKIRNVGVWATVAGTTTAHGFDIVVGTTSIGSVTLSTNAALSSATTGDLAYAVTAGQIIGLKSKADATGKAMASIEFEFTPGAQFNDP